MSVTLNSAYEVFTAYAEDIITRDEARQVLGFGVDPVVDAPVRSWVIGQVVQNDDYIELPNGAVVKDFGPYGQTLTKVGLAWRDDEYPNGSTRADSLYSDRELISLP